MFFCDQKFYLIVLILISVFFSPGILLLQQKPEEGSPAPLHPTPWESQLSVGPVGVRDCTVVITSPQIVYYLYNWVHWYSMASSSGY